MVIENKPQNIITKKRHSLYSSGISIIFLTVLETWQQSRLKFFYIYQCSVSGDTRASHNYLEIPGADPETLSTVEGVGSAIEHYFQ